MHTLLLSFLSLYIFAIARETTVPPKPEPITTESYSVGTGMRSCFTTTSITLFKLLIIWLLQCHTELFFLYLLCLSLTDTKLFDLSIITMYTFEAVSLIFL